MLNNALAYLDECGDMGWKLDQPYQDGGSSRYFVIAITVGINNQHRRFGKIVDKLHKQQKWTSAQEKKWATIRAPSAKKSFCQFLAVELATNQETKVLVAVLNKEKVSPFLSEAKGRSHVLYAAMVADLLAQKLPDVKSLSYCPDELNESYRVLESILAYKLIFQKKRDLLLKRVDYKSEMQRGLDCADLIAGAVWEAYERGNREFLDIIENHIEILEIL
jgi:hypothetical protein